MDLLTWGRSPWGEWILTHISWDLLWASLFAGVAFLVAHASYMVLSAHRKRDAAETDALEAARPRSAGAHHAALARGAAVPLGDGGGDVRAAVHRVPADRRREVRVGDLALDGRPRAHRVDPLPHRPRDVRGSTSGRSGSGPKDLPELKAELLRELGHDVPGPKPGKYPLGNRLYHLAIVLAGLAVVGDRALHDGRACARRSSRATRICSATPTWGVTYVTHGLAGVGARRPGDRARLLRGAAREVVDHQVDAPRLDHAAPVPRASRPAALDRALTLSSVAIST